MSNELSRIIRCVAQAFSMLVLVLITIETEGQESGASRATELSPAATRRLQEFRRSQQSIHVEVIQPAIEPPPVAPAPIPEAVVPDDAVSAPALDRARRVVLSADTAQASETVVRERVRQANPTLASGAVILPGAIEAPTASGGSVEIRHVAMPGRRLEYDASTEEFIGTLEVGVVAFGGDASSGLKEPVTFQLLQAGAQESSTVIVSGLAPPFKPIPIKVKNPRPPVKFRVASGTDQPTEEITLPVAPTLFVWPASTVLVGEGLGEIELLIVAVAEDGGKGQLVQLTAEPAAQFSRATVLLDDNGVATVRMRSVGTGAVTVGARAPGFTTAPTRLTYESVVRRLSINTDSDEIQGYGVGATMLTIVATTQDLRPDQIIQLNAEPRASFDRDEITLDKSGKAMVKVRSEGTGKVRITASAPGFEPAHKGLTFKPPIETIAACVVGGLLGGIARMLSNRRRGKQLTKVAAGLLLSVIVGILVFALFAIGINVLPITPTQTTGAIVVFTLAAIGAFIGVAVLPGRSMPKPAGH